MTEKRDVMEFPLEEVEIPQAIVIMMQAAFRTAEEDSRASGDKVDRLQLLCEKLEARVEDAIEEAKAPQTEQALTDAMDETPVDEGDVFLMEDGEVLNYKGVVYYKRCNAIVLSEDDHTTFCIKQWNHHWSEHEDLEGNYR